MATVTKPVALAHVSRRAAWLPLAVLPAAVALLGADWRPWVLMWALAGSIYFGVKWLTFADCGLARHASWPKSLGYLLLWPGMDGNAFFGRPVSSRTQPGQWILAAAKTACGVCLIYGAVSPVATWDEHLAVWVGLVGIVIVVHFGVFHLLALVWRHLGVPVQPIMQAPLRAASLSEFWGRRWNLAFRDLAHNYVFRPLAGMVGAAGATMAVFLASGIVHDVVIAGPARAGWGLPTLYFLLQGCGVLVEHSRVGRRIGLARHTVGRMFLVIVAVAPLPLLFHRPFVERVVLPMLTDIGAM
jgi:hypothetical protein